MLLVQAKTAHTAAMIEHAGDELPKQISTVPVACVDIGGTKVAVSLVDANGVHERLTEPTCKSGSNDALARQVIRLIGQSCKLAGLDAGDLAAVGVSSCGPFVMRNGLIELASPNICGGLVIAAGNAGRTTQTGPTIQAAQTGHAGRLPNDWTSALLEQPLRAVFKTVRIENDAIAALQAERRWGALRGNGQPLDDCAYVTWSTGVGVGLCVNGHVLRGKNGNAGHAGHQFVSDNRSALCGCGNIGDVEALIGGQGMGQRFAADGYASPTVLFQAAQSGDDAALYIVDELCRVMGRMLYNLVVTLDLQRISLGGSVFWNHREFLLPRLSEQLVGKLPALTDGFELVSAGLGQQVGDYGALALALTLTQKNQASVS